MKRMLLVLTALSAIAACSAAAAPNAQTMAAATPPAIESSVADLAGPPPSETYAAPPKAAPVERISASSRMDCDILARPTSHGVAISAVLDADEATSGDYDLVITKSGASGSSNVQQGGAFNAARGERVTLGETELGLDRGDRFHAVLTLTGADGRVCRQELRS